ncbi:hypothetical protein CO026_01845 [Candidatus Kaiserbacteria bacterium CG_4_9_14_0_2_um_filter_41_32]|uniref:NTP pyrophosphohydrolase MazG-like domain-containing protein n=1 Tax=Candidatus Kaiserbacteria bacterium CG_4_9_14_0_2_um_filter_41_32 TaxID=1974601 RepID=A0A2M8FF04_9BACT|nr:MAG: hypothetical protein CO026_01845 [Candidatus Kaiserbacteria bacterium CG_4_9_14_0_2_um_filter_41_32]
MKFSEYQEQSKLTAKYPNVGDDFVYPTLGLVGEAGEFANKIKKLMRDKNIFRPSAVSEGDRDDVLKELGDVLWYTAQLATEFGVNLDDVAKSNLEKLLSRLERNQIHGSGDNR